MSEFFHSEKDIASARSEINDLDLTCIDSVETLEFWLEFCVKTQEHYESNANDYDALALLGMTAAVADLKFDINDLLSFIETSEDDNKSAIMLSDEEGELSSISHDDTPATGAPTFSI